MQSTSARIDRATHQALEELAAALGTSVGGTVAWPSVASARTRSPPACGAGPTRTSAPGWMPTSGDVVEVDLGPPVGSEAGYRHLAVLVTAQRILDGGADVVHVAPLTSAVRGSASEVVVEADELDGLAARRRCSARTCVRWRSSAPARFAQRRPAVLSQVCDVLGPLLDIPG